MIPNYMQRAANERTFLAWVRTVMAIVGFGLVVARLGNLDTTLWSEVLLLVVGAAVVFLALSADAQGLQADQCGRNKSFIPASRRTFC